tara:strand:+ start:149 stop:454 length:306 start_codon:yes stop_codon:yes gene_type:complete
LAEKVKRSALAKIASLEEMGCVDRYMMGLINRGGSRTMCQEFEQCLESLAKNLDVENLSRDNASKVSEPLWSVSVMTVIFSTRNRNATRKKIYVGGVSSKI